MIGGSYKPQGKRRGRAGSKQQRLAWFTCQDDESAPPPPVADIQVPTASPIAPAPLLLSRCTAGPTIIAPVTILLRTTASLKKPVPSSPLVAPPPLAAADGRAAAVVHVVAELAPYARTGGLGEAVASLASFQAKAGIKVAVVMPLYREVANKYPNLKKLGEPFALTIGSRVEEGQLYQAPATGTGPQAKVVFVACQQYFDRAGIYGDGSRDFPDNARRYAFFCLGALLAIPQLFEAPVVLHAHDWHAALAPVYLRSWLRDHPFVSHVATVLSVHNAGFQGHFPPSTMPDLGLGWELYTPYLMEW